MEIKAIQCDSCGKLCPAGDKTYYSIHGNICAGDSGGLVGNNLDEKGVVIRVSHLCCSCLAKTLGFR